MHKHSLLYYLLPLIISDSVSLYPSHQTLHQDNVCTYQPTTSSVQCQCDKKGASNILTTRLDLFGQKVDNVLIESCTNLLFALDLHGVKTTSTTIKFKNCGKVQIVHIKYDPTFSGDQMLNIEVENMDKFTLQELYIDDSMRLSSTNVKELLIYKTIFSHLPTPGLTIEAADKVSIIDCVFNHTASGSISVDNVKEVEIVNNQFSINTIEVVNLKESPNSYISCNRLLEEAINMECSTISSALHTVSSTSSLPDSIISSLSLAFLDIKSEKQDSRSVNTILWVLVTVGLVVLSVVFICICCRRRQHKKESDEEKNVFKHNIETEKLEGETNDEKEVMLTPDFNTDIVLTSDKVADDIIEKVKEQEAILQRKIQGMKVIS